MHALRHTAAINLLAAGVDVSVIALWLGHADTHSTTPASTPTWPSNKPPSSRTRPPHVRPGTYRPEPDVLAWLTSL